MHKNIEEILLNNMKLPQYRKTWKRACCLLTQMLGLYHLSTKDRKKVQLYWEILFVRIAGEKHLENIKKQERCALKAVSKIIESKECSNDNQ